MPVMNVDGASMAVRRALFQEVHGPVKAGHEIVPSCETRLCVHPTHTEQITSTERRRRMAVKRKSLPTTAAMIARNRSLFAKLDMEKARHIRVTDERSDVLAARYGVSRTLINNVRNGSSWAEPSPFAGLGSRA